RASIFSLKLFDKEVVDNLFIPSNRHSEFQITPARSRPFSGARHHLESPHRSESTASSNPVLRAFISLVSFFRSDAQVSRRPAKSQQPSANIRPVGHAPQNWWSKPLALSKVHHADRAYPRGACLGYSRPCPIHRRHHATDRRRIMPL